MEPQNVTTEIAIQLLQLKEGRACGSTVEGEEIRVFNGRYGLYIKAGKETRSLAEGDDPFVVDEERCRALLAQPKQRGRAAAKPPIQTFENVIELEGATIMIKDGRFGPYATDGETNATLAKDQDPQKISSSQAAQRILDKRERDAKKGKKTRKKTAKKKTAKKKTTKKKTTKKKTTKKKTAKKDRKENHQEEKQRVRGTLATSLLFCLGVGSLLGCSGGPRKTIEAPVPISPIEMQWNESRDQLVIRTEEGPISTLRLDQSRPCLFPLHSPSGSMVSASPSDRNPAASDEQQDHPHHAGAWIAHGSIDGHDFWHGQRPGKSPVIGHPSCSTMVKYWWLRANWTGWPEIKKVIEENSHLRHSCRGSSPSD